MLDGLVFLREGPHVHPGETVCHRVYAMLPCGKSCRQWQAGIVDVAGLSCDTLLFSVNSEHLLLVSS